MTRERFIQFLEKFNSPKNKVINTKFEIITKPDEIDNFKVTSKIKIRCKNCGYIHEIEARRLLWNNSRRIKKCKNCERGINYFLNLVKKYGLDKYLKFPNLEKEYKNMHSKITCICIRHNNKFKIIAGSLFLNYEKRRIDKNKHIYFKYCDKCREELVKDTKSIGKEELIRKFNEKFDKKYKLVEEETEFDKPIKKAKVTFICPKHGKQVSKWLNLIHVRKGDIPCVKCIEEKNMEIFYDRRKWTYEKLLEVNKELFGNKYEIVYFSGKKSVKDKIKIICPKHGEFEQYITNFVRGHQCIKCAAEYKADVQKKYQSIEELERKVLKNILKHEYKKKFDIDLNKTNFPLSVFDTVYVNCYEHGAVQVKTFSIENGIYCPICVSSKLESDFIRALREEIGYNGYIKKLRKIPGTNYEIDVFVPELSLGFELHGIYFHSIGLGDYSEPESFKLKKWKHYKKASAAAQNDIRLIQIFEHEWINNSKRKIWLSIIKNALYLLPKENKIHARKLNLRIRTDITSEIIEFFNNNHLDGYIPGSYYVTLEDNYGEIYSGLIIGKHRFRKKNKEIDENVLEIFRFATKIDYSVRGAFSKMLFNFLKYIENKVKHIFLISYIDRRINNLGKNNYLIKNGFKFIKTTTQPNYYYFREDDRNNLDKLKLYHRQEFMKYKLKEILPNYNPKLTEMENMILNNYRIIFDAGHNLYAFDYR